MYIDDYIQNNMDKGIVFNFNPEDAPKLAKVLKCKKYFRYAVCWLT